MNPYKPPEARVEDPGTKDGKLMPATCSHCGHSFEGPARKTFLGFQKFTCEKCGKEFSSVLFRGYRITYWVLLALSLAAMVTTTGARPSIFAILMAIAVSIDAYRLWKRPRA